MSLHRTGRHTLRQILSYIAYYGMAQHLPWSIQPLGGTAKRVRAAACRNLFDAFGQGVNVEQGAWFGSGAGIRVGDRSSIGKDARLMGPCTLGADVMMGPGCFVLSGAHNHSDLTVPMNTQGMAPDRPIVVEDDVWIGAAAVLLPGVRVGRGAIVAAGAIVTRDVEPYTVVGATLPS